MLHALLPVYYSYKFPPVFSDHFQNNNMFSPLFYHFPIWIHILYSRFYSIQIFLHLIHYYNNFLQSLISHLHNMITISLLFSIYKISCYFYITIFIIEKVISYSLILYSFIFCLQLSSFII